MNFQDLQIQRLQMQKLLATANADVALLYLYLHSGNALEKAEEELHISAGRVQCAAATLRQLGLWMPEKQQKILAGERPQYSENDVIRAMDTSVEFRALYEELQRLFGRSLNTEELKIVLGFTNYLGLPMEVISVLVCYCKDRARQKGGLRNPSLRTIEKEAYHWAEQGIDTMEEAVAYIQRQNQRNSSLSKLMQLLQIRGRNLTPGEEKYAVKWLEWGFDKEAISMAYERTCLNVGGLNWAYMNKILTRWHEAGLHTGAQVRSGDKKPLPKGASGQLGQAELDAIKNILKEDQ